MNGNTLRAPPHHGWFDDFFSSLPSAANVLKTHHPRDILFLLCLLSVGQTTDFFKNSQKNPLLTFCPNNNHYYYYMNNKPEKPDFSCQWPEEFLKAQAPKMSPSLSPSLPFHEFLPRMTTIDPTSGHRCAAAAEGLLSAYLKNLLF